MLGTNLFLSGKKKLYQKERYDFYRFCPEVGTFFFNRSEAAFPMNLPPISYPLVSAVLTALVYVVIELLLSAGFDKTALAATFGLIGGVVLLLSTKPKVLFPSLKELSKKIPALLLASFFGFAFSRLIEVAAIGMAGASKIAVMAQLEPIFVILLAAVFLKERPGAKKLVCGSLIVIGAILANVHDTSGLKFILGTGEVLGVIFPLGFALAVIFLTGLNKSIEPRVVTGCAMIMGSLIISAFYGVGLYSGIVAGGPLFGTVLLASGLLTGLYWLAYNMGLRLLGASITSIVYASTPLFTFLFSSIAVVFCPNMILAPENPKFLISGAILILAGTFLLAKAERGKIILSCGHH